MGVFGLSGICVEFMLIILHYKKLIIENFGVNVEIWANFIFVAGLALVFCLE